MAQRSDLSDQRPGRCRTRFGAGGGTVYAVPVCLSFVYRVPISSFSDFFTIHLRILSS